MVSDTPNRVLTKLTVVPSGSAIGSDSSGLSPPAVVFRRLRDNWMEWCYNGSCDVSRNDHGPQGNQDKEEETRSFKLLISPSYGALLSNDAIVYQSTLYKEYRSDQVYKTTEEKLELKVKMREVNLLDKTSA